MDGVFTASTDQSHWRQEIVNWDSTGFAIVLSQKELSAQSLFIPESKRNVRGHATHELPEATFRRTLTDFAQIERLAEKPSPQNRHRAIISKAVMP